MGDFGRFPDLDMMEEREEIASPPYLVRGVRPAKNTGVNQRQLVLVAVGRSSGGYGCFTGLVMMEEEEEIVPSLKVPAGKSPAKKGPT